MRWVCGWYVVRGGGLCRGRGRVSSRWGERSAGSAGVPEPRQGRGGRESEMFLGNPLDTVTSPDAAGSPPPTTHHPHSPTASTGRRPDELDELTCGHFVGGHVQTGCERPLSREGRDDAG